MKPYGAPFGSAFRTGGSDALLLSSEGDERETVRVEGGVSASHLITFRCPHHSSIGDVVLDFEARDIAASSLEASSSAKRVMCQLYPSR